MKTYKIDITGITPYSDTAKNEAELLRKIRSKFGKKCLNDRKISIVEWKEYTINDLVKELSKFDGNMKVCIPNSGGTRFAQFLPVVKGVVEVETEPAWGTGLDPVVKMVCLETNIISPFLS